MGPSGGNWRKKYLTAVNVSAPPPAAAATAAALVTGSSKRSSLTSLQPHEDELSPRPRGASPDSSPVPGQGEGEDGTPLSALAAVAATTTHVHGGFGGRGGSMEFVNLPPPSAVPVPLFADQLFDTSFGSASARLRSRSVGDANGSNVKSAAVPIPLSAATAANVHMPAYDHRAPRRSNPGTTVTRVARFGSGGGGGGGGGGSELLDSTADGSSYGDTSTVDSPSESGSRGPDRRKHRGVGTRGGAASSLQHRRRVESGGEEDDDMFGFETGATPTAAAAGGKTGHRGPRGSLGSPPDHAHAHTHTGSGSKVHAPDARTGEGGGHDRSSGQNEHGAERAHHATSMDSSDMSSSRRSSECGSASGLLLGSSLPRRLPHLHPSYAAAVRAVGSPHVRYGEGGGSGSGAHSVSPLVGPLAHLAVSGGTGAHTSTNAHNHHHQHHAVHAAHGHGAHRRVSADSSDDGSSSKYSGSRRSRKDFSGEGGGGGESENEGEESVFPAGSPRAPHKRAALTPTYGGEVQTAQGAPPLHPHASHPATGEATTSTAVGPSGSAGMGEAEEEEDDLVFPTDDLSLVAEDYEGAILDHTRGAKGHKRAERRGGGGGKAKERGHSHGEAPAAPTPASKLAVTGGGVSAGGVSGGSGGAHAEGPVRRGSWGSTSSSHSGLLVGGRYGVPHAHHHGGGSSSRAQALNDSPFMVGGRGTVPPSPLPSREEEEGEAEESFPLPAPRRLKELLVVPRDGAIRSGKGVGFVRGDSGSVGDGDDDDGGDEEEEEEEEAEGGDGVGSLPRVLPGRLGLVTTSASGLAAPPTGRAGVHASYAIHTRPPAVPMPVGLKGHPAAAMAGLGGGATAATAGGGGGGDRRDRRRGVRGAGDLSAVPASEMLLGSSFVPPHLLAQAEAQENMFSLGMRAQMKAKPRNV